MASMKMEKEITNNQTDGTKKNKKMEGLQENKNADETLNNNCTFRLRQAASMHPVMQWMDVMIRFWKHRRFVTLGLFAVSKLSPYSSEPLVSFATKPLLRAWLEHADNVKVWDARGQHDALVAEHPNAGIGVFATRTMSKGRILSRTTAC